jgi:hypothetical protein
LQKRSDSARDEGVEDNDDDEERVKGDEVDAWFGAAI